MADINPFYPLPKSTVNIPATNVSASVALPPRDEEGTIRIYNAASVIIFINFHKTSAATSATTSGMPIPPGVVEIDRLPPEINYMSAITASGSGTIYFTPGKGV